MESSGGRDADLYKALASQVKRRWVRVQTAGVAVARLCCSWLCARVQRGSGVPEIPLFLCLGDGVQMDTGLRREGGAVGAAADGRGDSLIRVALRDRTVTRPAERRGRAGGTHIARTRSRTDITRCDSDTTVPLHAWRPAASNPHPSPTQRTAQQKPTDLCRCSSCV